MSCRLVGAGDEWFTLRRFDSGEKDEDEWWGDEYGGDSRGRLVERDIAELD